MAAMADVSVRPATSVDVTGIGQVQARAWTSGYAGLLGPDLLAEITPEDLADAWRPAVVDPPSPRHVVVVALAGTEVVGFAAASPSGDEDAVETDGEIIALVVDPAHVRKGHGSRLLSATTDTLRDVGIKVLHCWVPRTDHAQREFLAGAGLVADGATREAEAIDGRRLVEVRMVAALA